ncbi:hypothetical protein IDJ77_20435 [Mucilaginibacter sp. ZT4R22]|uniref:Uncharacterized protein n=1 Tax=Mucilaginibacter pankratovii TaxID=2772110 RepID=A0ABR7WV59_9SPHI|nr:hypothetical protein [Mucilaginibacter pankratovii]MBD1366191.1 hypothetical protein [Mucilaginibacter pankratovii]
MQKEGFYIARWRQVTEEALDWGSSAGWSDLDFEKLSERFLHKTGTMLSVTTLKRIWGKVKYDSTPNAATLNALAKFAGYDDWRAFKQNIDTENVPLATAIKLPTKRRNYLPAIISMAVTLLVLVAILAWIIKPKQPEMAATNVPVKFEARVVAEGLPNSVVFNYDASGLHTDSLTLQQTWDPSRTERIAASGRQHTSIYYHPGYFTAKLIDKGQVKKETPVYVQTKGWVGLLDKFPVPTYLSAADIHLPGALGLPAKNLARKTGLPVFNGQWLRFYNVREFDGINGSDFTLETTLRNTSTPEESSCRNVIVYILGKQNAIIIPLANKGCSSALTIFTSSDWIHGKDRDLSAFGCDFSQFQNLRCSVKNMQLTVQLNGVQIFKTPITQTIKDIAGICVAFEGAGEIQDIKLSNSNKVALDDSF